ncbi:MAG: hypothetical protein H7Z43_00605 [Clostridia bacterium]|nr:hypothetical protein [Deltaproteobacteria bacterium]
MNTKSVLAVVCLGFAGCGENDNNDADHNHGGDANGDDTCVATTSVTILDFAYVPSCAQVAVGETVTFTNQDRSAHTATTDDGQNQAFDSGTLSTGKAYQVTITNAGTLAGHCNFHPDMFFKIEAR